VRALLRDLHGAAGQAVPLKELLSTMSLNMITRMVLGRKAVDREVVASGRGVRDDVEGVQVDAR
jgi:hypothetical protein